MGIVVTDQEPHEVLIDADIAGRLLTSKVAQFSCGLTATETY